MKRTIFPAICGLTIIASMSGSAMRLTEEDVLTLSVQVKSRHIDYFETCLPVRVNAPFRIVWGSETVKSVIAGTVGAPVDGAYPTKLTISEGNGQCRTKTVAGLKLDKPEESTLVASIAFSHFDTHRFVLSKKPCTAAAGPDASSEDMR